MVVRTALAAAALLLATGCADEPAITDGLDRIGSTRSGAEVYAARVGGDRVSVVVLVEDETWCNGSGPSGTDPRTVVAVCNDSSPHGSVYAEPVAKGAEPGPVCEQQTGAPVALERVVTPRSWDLDLAVSITSEQSVSLARCARP